MVEADLIAKIRDAIAKEGQIEEADVRSLMILIRKLLDGMPQRDQQSFVIVRLFCNWTAHTEITRSNTGLRVLSAVNDALVTFRNSSDPIAMRTAISHAIGFSALRQELRAFLGHIGVDNAIVADDRIWAVLVDHLLEIVRDVPLSFPALSGLDPAKRKIYEAIARNPIKPGAGVIAIQVSHVDYAALGSKESGTLLCLLIRTEDTTTTVVPLLIDVPLGK